MIKNSCRVGVIGVGHLGNFHVQQLLKISNHTFVGVFDSDPRRARYIAKKYSVPCFNSLNLLLQKCNAVSIATPAVSHFSLAMRALEHGCHVFIEKPFVTTLSHADKIINLAKDKQKLIQIGHIERFNPVFLKFISLNPVPLFIETHRLAPFNVRGTDVNVILDLMIHDIDLVLSLVNCKIKKISSNGVKILSNSYDLVNATLEFENGCIANLTASRLSVSSMRKMRVFEKASYSSINFQTLTLEKYVTKNKKPAKNLVFEHNNKYIHKEIMKEQQTNPLYQELDAFINSIYFEKKIKVGAEEAKKTLAVALKIRNKIHGRFK